MAIIGNTDAASVIDKLVLEVIQETLIQRSVMVPLVEDLSAYALPGHDRIDYPTVSALSTADKAEDTNDTPQAPTIAVDQLSLDKHKIISWELEDITNIQSKPNLLAKIVADSAKVMAAKVDDDILTELRSTVSTAAPDHALVFADFTATAFQRAMVTEARRLLNVQHVDQSDRFLVISPGAEKELLDLDDFVHVDKYGAGAMNSMQNGELGRIFGFTVVMSSSSVLDAKEALFFHRSAIAYASQAGVKGLEQDRDILGKKDQYSMDMLYGVKGLDGVRAVQIKEA